MDETTFDAYFGRIAVPRPYTGDAVSLHVLHRAHQMTVPFENLSVHLPEPISLTEDDLIDKIVHRRRGGFCYELNGALGTLLETMGAQVQRMAARVYSDGRTGPPFGHMALVVRATDASGPWLVDVGFGSHSVYPLLYDSRHEQDDPAGRFLLVDTDDGDVDVLKDGQPQYRIEPRPRSLADFIPTCWWQATSPSSHFTRGTICSRLTKDGRISISDRTLITTERGTRHGVPLPSDAAVLAAYREHFGIVLDAVPRPGSTVPAAVASAQAPAPAQTPAGAEAPAAGSGVPPAAPATSGPPAAGKAPAAANAPAAENRAAAETPASGPAEPGSGLLVPALPRRSPGVSGPVPPRLVRRPGGPNGALADGAAGQRLGASRPGDPETLPGHGGDAGRVDLL